MSDRATKVITAIRSCGWGEYKQTHRFVYLRAAGVPYTIAVCKTTGYNDYYPLRWVEIEGEQS